MPATTDCQARRFVFLNTDNGKIHLPSPYVGRVLEKNFFAMYGLGWRQSVADRIVDNLFAQTSLGENGGSGAYVLVPVTLEDLGKRIAIENQDTGHKALLDLITFASPCRDFSLFATRSQHGRLPADKLKETLQFLGNGRRGFLLVLSEGQETVVVRRGDKVFVVGPA